MGAKGNRFWERRSTHGRKPIFESPNDLLEASLEYLEHCTENPLFEMKAFVVNGEVHQEPIYKMRAFTMGGLQIFLDIDRKTWANYKAKDDFIAVISQIEEIIRDQKFTGAAAGLLNANIIARDLGLKDISETDITSGGEPIKQNITFVPVNSKDESSSD